MYVKKNRKSGGKTVKLTLEYAKEKFAEKGWTLLATEYKNAHTPMEYMCNKGHKHSIQWANFQQGFGCPDCHYEHLSEIKRMPFEEVKAFIEQQSYKLLSENYKNAHQKLLLECPHGHIFTMNFDKFKSGQRCPICIGSSGEKEVRKYLNQLEIEFIEQKRFEECRNILPLPFDFYIPSLNMCIEYDGEQHFLKGCFGDTKGQVLLETQKRDNIKTQYCLDNNIKLIRIPYWEFNNIENILKQAIN